MNLFEKWYTTLTDDQHTTIAGLLKLQKTDTKSIRRWENICYHHRGVHDCLESVVQTKGQLKGEHSCEFNTLGNEMSIVLQDRNEINSVLQREIFLRERYWLLTDEIRRQIEKQSNENQEELDYVEKETEKVRKPKKRQKITPVRAKRKSVEDSMVDAMSRYYVRQKKMTQRIRDSIGIQ